MTIDGAAQPGSFGTSATQDLPFACDGSSHTYLLTAFGAGDRTRDGHQDHQPSALTRRAVSGSVSSRLGVGCVAAAARGALRGLHRALLLADLA